ncbi:N-acetylmuramoyl-L-alanine amidase [Achromobacter sp. GG226]|uniref:N-acetylmuramoyl-L-alanine amidase n=1 Tax=Verticiella alkaliphila TaxID=2779529 RepID=UPI001C0AD604|nr:N-acetylmuramoyl-L-alanine amidase [Verticiella sp. GG226]MBU4612656.1 N-acetylmuramoyl-L-alanine amidase [Verticiella sp. GG226]
MTHLTTAWRRFLLAASVTLLAGCAATGPEGLRIDRSIEATGQGSRAQFLVIHYTATDRDRSLHLLSKEKVSSHYLVTDDTPPQVYQLVDENRAAWHAGESQWRGRTFLNASSIGIEIVNPGFTDNPDGTRQWYPFSAGQIDAVTKLIRDITQRHGIAPQDVVAHSDIAPQRKQDPGPLFPWADLAAQGLVRWYDPAAVAAHQVRFARDGVPDVAWFQTELTRIGYAVPRHGMFDQATRNVIAAFQMRYRPQDIAGQPDLQTAAILAAVQ